MSRPRDSLAVELISPPPNATRVPGAGSVFDRFTSVRVTTDITAPSEASFELGDDGSWRDLEAYVAHGARYRVFVNDRPLLTGRVEMQDIPQDARAGTVVRFTIRTKLQDAFYRSAAEDVRVKKTSLKTFILALYAPLGYTESDFVFRGSVARDLITGRSSTNQGTDLVNIEPIKPDAAKVKPPETIFEAADRHLRRHGLMHWDSPDGRIVVGAPNDSQTPLYTLVSTRENSGRGNNICSNTRTRDWSGLPSSVRMFGVGSGRGTSRARVSSVVWDADVASAGFSRPVTILAEAIRTQALADRAAQRELAARSKSKDAFEIETDGLSWWSGHGSVPWGIDTVAEVVNDGAGGRCGAYYLHRVTLSRDAGKGDTANLSLVRKGVWRL